MVRRWRKLELTSATAGTLKSGLPPLCRCIWVSDWSGGKFSAESDQHWLAWISCLPAGLPLTKLCKLCQIDCQPPSLQYHCCSCKSWYGGKADVWTMRMVFCRRAGLHCRSDDSCFYLLAHIPHCFWCTAVALLCRIQSLARMQLQGFRCDQHWHLPPHAPVEPYFLSW